MKPAVVASLLALSLRFAFADDIRTITGQVYKDATISRAEPDGIVIMISSGIVKIRFTELSPEIQKKYGYDPSAAAKFAAETAAQQQAIYTASQAAKNRIAAQTNALLDKQYKEAQAHKDRDAVASFSLDAHETATGPRRPPNLRRPPVEPNSRRDCEQATIVGRADRGL